MKFKLSVLASALVLASGVANAAITSGATGNSEVILSVFDSTTKASAAFDLGVTMDQFLAGGSFGNASWNLKTNATAGAAAGTTVSFGNVFNSFLSGATGTVSYSVIGLNDSAVQYVSTSTSLTAPLTQVDSKTFNFALMETYVNGLNALGNANANGAYLVTDTTNAANFSKANATKWKNNSSFVTNGTIGTGLTFWSELATGNQYSAAQNLGTFNLDAGTGVLSYVAAVPEPSEYALMAAGLLVMGGIARRRKQA